MRSIAREMRELQLCVLCRLPKLRKVLRLKSHSDVCWCSDMVRRDTSAAVDTRAAVATPPGSPVGRGGGAPAALCLGGSPLHAPNTPLMDDGVRRRESPLDRLLRKVEWDDEDDE